VTALAVAPDGKSVVVGSQAGIEVRSYPTLESTRTLPTEIPNVHDLAFSPDGKTLAVAGGVPGKRGRIEFFSWPEGKLLRTATVHRDCVYKVAWRSDSAALLTAGGGANVCVVQVETGKLLQTLDGHSKGVLAVAFLPGEEQFASAGLDESVRLWNKHGEPVRSFPNHTRPVTDLAIRPGTDAKTPPTLVSVSEDRTVRLWQPTVGRLVRFARLDVVPLAVAWSKDGDRILTACKDGRLRLLDPDTMDVTETLPAIDGVAYCLAVGPDSGVLVGGQSGQLKRVAVKK
jgi:WD40 repeat protein